MHATSTAARLGLTLLMLTVAACGGSSESTPPQGTSTSTPTPTPPSPPPATPAPTPADPAPVPTPAPIPAPAQPQALPVLDIDTSGVAITSKEDYVAGSYTINDALGSRLHGGALEIRGRGNLTWTLDKKPYRIKLGTSAPLLSMPNNRHWVLLANHIDRTLLRNDVAFEFGRRLGFAYTPRSTFVHVNLNGSYEGVYQLTEQIRPGADRVDIELPEEVQTSVPEITGGYLVEIDARWSEAFCFRATISGMVFCAKDPETLAEPAWAPQRNYLQGYLQGTEDAIFSPGFADPAQGYAAWLDVDTTVDNYIAQELFKNVDGNLTFSTYLVKRRSGKVEFGPLWDFDLSLGAVTDEGCDNPVGWRVRPAPWYTRLFEDPVFAQKVKSRWNALMQQGQIRGLLDHIDRRATELSQAQVSNFNRWPVFDLYVYNNRVNPGSYEGEIQVMKAWFVQRIDWMDAEINR